MNLVEKGWVESVNITVPLFVSLAGTPADPRTSKPWQGCLDEGTTTPTANTTSGEFIADYWVTMNNQEQ